MPRVGYTTTCRRSLVGSFNRFPRRTLAGSVRHRVAPPEPHHLPFERYQSNGSIFELATVIDVGFKSAMTPNNSHGAVIDSSHGAVIDSSHGAVID